MLTRFFRTYDVYKRYINPAATEAQILRMSHWMVLFYAVFMGLAGLIFYYIGISMGWLYVRELYCLLCDLLTFH
jgi:Na+/proline symporter